MRTRQSIGAALAAVVLLTAASRRAAAQEPPVPEVTVRAFGGLGSGAGADVWSDQLVRADFAIRSLVLTPFQWFSAGLVVPISGTPRRFAGLRTGYQLEYDGDERGTWTGSRTAHAVDAGAVARTESAAGSALEVQVGIEDVFRPTPAGCCDSALLPESSLGFRVAMTGELALWSEMALFAQAELRTGAHLLEIGWLPTAAAGVRYRF